MPTQNYTTEATNEETLATPCLARAFEVPYVDWLDRNHLDGCRKMSI